MIDMLALPTFTLHTSFIKAENSCIFASTSFIKAENSCCKYLIRTLTLKSRRYGIICNAIKDRLCIIMCRK
jgi:hypothetical protein